ncbi:outer membrane lipoprotein chaperone LolA [Morganella psychrotolerans]|uniref:Outer-membrane lipoprotein carrier protein n=1 Tax=Morganella psychrotolerans TaxID=368603 RepID=A0A1B8HDZ9_9GAMM|nr:outer membrane lipoprotein chaperone LolA [Morganella psychrotolerans]OBU07304.1 outer-membrane lipoprotein carrier protein LolA [Morganella psychrotolerans]
MKKVFITTCLLAGLSVSAAHADTRSDLQTRLGKVNSFHANFSQKVTDADGALVQEGTGDLWVKRPNLFNWQMSPPDESVLVSDGKTLWFYNPFVEQATATRLNDATQNTPFMLITRNDPADWQQYMVSQHGDNFELKPKVNNGNLKVFTITVTPEGTIQQFAAVEQDGQKSTYQLKGQQSTDVNMSKFTFTLPEGVTLDDQRQ